MKVLADANIDLTVTGVNKTPIYVMQVLYSLNTLLEECFISP